MKRKSKAGKPSRRREQEANSLLGLVLIDTSTWILTLGRKSLEHAKKEVDRLIAENRAATAGIVVLELLSGTKTKEEYLELKEDLEALVQLDVTPNTWEQASQLAYELRRKGVTIPSADILIMTIAVENGCALLHADRHFDLMIEQGVGLPPRMVRNILEQGERE